MRIGPSLISMVFLNIAITFFRFYIPCYTELLRYSDNIFVTVCVIEKLLNLEKTVLLFIYLMQNAKKTLATK